MNTLRYIGPFFRMNNLSPEDISSQLFYFAKETVKILCLESKCGILASTKNFKKINTTIDITTISNFSPLLCIYKKSSPTLIHTKNSTCLDDTTFKKEISPKTNALLTLSLLELIEYYDYFKDIDNKNYSLSGIYKELAKNQLVFYSDHLRSTEGYFICKKNTSGNNHKNFTLIDKDKNFNFLDQAYMMLCYYTYSQLELDDELLEEYKLFSLEILQMFIECSSNLYDCSFEELCNILFAFNIFYSKYKGEDCKNLLIDISDYLICKYNEGDYLVENFEYTSFLSLNLLLAYNNTNIISFLETHKDINQKLFSLYDTDKELFYKLDGKKTSKYSCLDITFYLMNFLCSNESNLSTDDKKHLSSIYKKFIINSGIVSSWPDPPTLDDYERYKKFSLNSTDMLDESVFRMVNLQSPITCSTLPMFHKKVSYDKKKDEFSSISKNSFDSDNNLIILFLFISLLKDNMISILELKTSEPEVEMKEPDITTTPSTTEECNED